MFNRVDFDIVLLGNLSQDINIYPGGKKIKVPGGGVYYGAFPLKKIGINVGVCTKLAKNDFRLLAKFKKANISVFAIKGTGTISFENIYPKKDFSQRIQKALARGEKIKIKEIPLFKTKVIHFTPLFGEVSLGLVKKFSRETVVSLDVQGFIRKTRYGKIIISKWPEKRKILKYVDILKLDLEEGNMLTGYENPEKMANTLAKFGPREVLITSDKGVSLLANKKFYFRKFRPKEIIGRTGRGDTCIASYLGKRLKETPEKALDFAANITTFKLEREGPYK